MLLLRVHDVDNLIYIVAFISGVAYVSSKWTLLPVADLEEGATGGSLPSEDFRLINFVLYTRVPYADNASKKKKKGH